MPTTWVAELTSACRASRFGVVCTVPGGPSSMLEYRQTSAATAPIGTAP